LSACTPFPTCDTTQTHPNDSALVFPKHALGALCCTTQRQLTDFQIHFMEQSFWHIFVWVGIPRDTKFASNAAKNSSEFQSPLVEYPCEGENSGEICGGKSKNHACKTRGSRHLDCPKATVLVPEGTISVCIPKLLAVACTTKLPQASCPPPGNRTSLESSFAGRVPARLKSNNFQPAAVFFDLQPMGSLLCSACRFCAEFAVRRVWVG